MTILTSVILLGVIFIITVGVSYLMQIGQLTTKEWNDKMTQNLLKQQEIDELNAGIPQEDKISLS